MTERSPLRILTLSPLPPYPTHCGWSTSIYNMLLGLHKLGHEIYLLAKSDDPDHEIEHIRGLCHTEYFHTPRPSRVWQVATNLGREEPFSITRYFDAKLLKTAEELISAKNIDVVLVEDLAMAPYGPLLEKSHGLPYFIRTHNIDTQIYQRYAEQERNPFLRLAAQWQLAKMTRYEADALRRSPDYSVLGHP